MSLSEYRRAVTRPSRMLSERMQDSHAPEPPGGFVAYGHSLQPFVPGRECVPDSARHYGFKHRDDGDTTGAEVPAESVHCAEEVLYIVERLIKYDRRELLLWHEPAIIRAVEFAIREPPGLRLLDSSF